MQLPLMRDDLVSLSFCIFVGNNFKQLLLVLMLNLNKEPLPNLYRVELDQRGYKGFENIYSNSYIYEV